jgi:hypothetical protein
LFIEIAYLLTFLTIGEIDSTSSEEEEIVSARPLQTVLPSLKRSTRVEQRAVKKITKAKKQPIKTEVLPSLLFKITTLELFLLLELTCILMKQVKQTPTRDKRKIILSSSESESEEKLKRRPK